MPSRFKNVSSTGPFSVQIGSGGAGKFVQVTNYGQAQTALILPKIVATTQRTGQTLSLQPGGLTGITARQWKSNGSNIGGATGTTYSGQSENQQISCAITCDQGVVETPKMQIVHSHSDPTHDAMDDAAVSLIPHSDITHTAIADGNWTDVSTWDAAEVPPVGAVVLIPIGRTVTYDSVSAPRLDRLRVDGTLIWSITKSTNMLVETILGTVTSQITIGTENNPLPDAYKATITFSDRDVRTSPSAASDINIVTDPTLLGRGILTQGGFTTFGRKLSPWLFTATASAPLVGATSAVLAKAPVNWKVGDRIVIPGTMVHLSSTTGTGTNTRYDEERVITSFSTTNVANDTVHWTGGLSYNHDHHNAAVTRTDLQTPIANRERNIIFKSESTVRQRRGHQMSLHHSAQTSMKWAATLEMGRTSKMIPAGIIEAGQFKRYEASTHSFETETLTAASNLQSRYSIHAHFTGFGKTVRSVYTGLYVEGNQGWAMVHHGADVDFFDCTIYRFGGAGMVAERGNEIGGWAGNLCFGLETTHGDYGLIKGREAGQGIKGDVYSWGYNYAMRGRAVRTSNNVAVAGTWGFALYHRSNTPTISPVSGPLRAYSDLKDLKLIEDTDQLELQLPKYPLLDMSDNYVLGCYGAMGVVKAGAAHEHDVSIVLKRLKAVCRIGHLLNYIGNYVVEDADLISMNPSISPAYPVANNGIHAHEDNQVAFIRVKTERFNTGMLLSSGTAVFNANHFSAEDWRFAIVAHTSISDGTKLSLVTENGTPPPATCADVTKIYLSEPTYLDYPSLSHADLPFILYTWSGGNNAVTGQVSGFKKDTSDPAGIYAAMPKVWDNAGFGAEAGTASGVNCRVYEQNYGHYTYNGDKIALLPLYVSDRLTGHTIKVMRAFKCTGNLNGVDHGTFTLSATGPSRSAMTVAVTKNTPITFNGITDQGGTTVESGATAVLDASFLPAEHGQISVNTANGEITYVPDPDKTGADEMYFFIYDGRGRFVTTRVTFTVT